MPKLCFARLSLNFVFAPLSSSLPHKTLSRTVAYVITRMILLRHGLRSGWTLMLLPALLLTHDTLCLMKLSLNGLLLLLPATMAPSPS